MLLHENLTTRMVKRIILNKLKINDSWIKFMLSEKYFDDKSRISDFLISTELIGMIIFKVQEKILILNTLVTHLNQYSIMAENLEMSS
jgi:hypothetical protein